MGIANQKSLQLYKDYKENFKFLVCPCQVKIQYVVLIDFLDTKKTSAIVGLKDNLKVLTIVDESNLTPLFN